MGIVNDRAGMPSTVPDRASASRHIYCRKYQGAMMSTIELTMENFEDVVTGNDVVIVDFWASWCGPCRAFAPTFEAASERHPEVVFAKVNTEEQQELAGAFNIRSIPTLMVFREKVILYSEAGALPPPALEDVINQTLQMDMAVVHQEIAQQRDGEGTA
jgi:thioredoxin 1